MLVAVALVLGVVVQGKPNGAPPEACKDLMPRHRNNTPQTGKALFLYNRNYSRAQ